MNQCNKFLFIIVFTLCMATLDVVTIKYTCFHEDGGPHLYGTPFIYRTSIPWVNSLEGEIFVKGFGLNILAWGSFFGVMYYAFKRNVKIKSKKIKRSINIFMALFNIAALALLTLNLFLFDWRWHWDYEYTLTEYTVSIEFLRMP